MNETAKRLLLPSLGDFVFLIVFLFLVWMLPTYLYSDGGTGWHLATGRFIAETGSIPHSDFISYTFPNRPWISQYWLSDLVMYWIQHSLGYNGLAVAFAAVYGILFMALYHQCRQEGGSSLPVFALTFIGALVASVQFLARPITVTWFMVGWFAILLDRYQNNKLTAKWLTICIAGSSILWANCHSGYIIGVTQIAIYLAYNFVPAIFHSEPEPRAAARRKVAALSIALIAALIGVTLNPYGIALHTNIFETLGNKAIIDSVEEFMSPTFHGGIQPNSLELYFALIIALLAITSIRVCLPRAMTAIAFCHLTLYSLRNAPLLVFIAAPFISHLSSKTRLLEVIGPQEPANNIARKLLNGFIERCQRLDAQEVLNGYHLLPAFFVVFFLAIAANNGEFLGQKVLQCDYNDGRFPTTTLDSVARLGLNPSSGFNHVNWGGYMFYKTRQPVYIDDRGTFFGNFYVRYGTIVSLYPGWQDLLKKDGINWILYPKNSDFANALNSDPDWRLADQDNAAFLFVRKSPVSRPSGPFQWQ